MAVIVIECIEPGDAWNRFWATDHAQLIPMDIDWTQSGFLIYAPLGKPALKLKMLNPATDTWVFWFPQAEHMQLSTWWNSVQIQSRLNLCVQYYTRGAPVTAWDTFKFRPGGMFGDMLSTMSLTSQTLINQFPVEYAFEKDGTLIRIRVVYFYVLTGVVHSFATPLSIIPCVTLWQVTPVEFGGDWAPYLNDILFGWGSVADPTPVARLKILTDALEASTGVSGSLWRGRQRRFQSQVPDGIVIPASNGSIDTEIDRMMRLLQRYFLTRRVIWDKDGGVSMDDGIVYKP